MKILNSTFLASVFFAGVSTACWAAGDSLLSVQPTQSSTEWTLRYKQQKLMVYAFEPRKYKPYVKELCTIQGYNILRDAPHDHLHHHALMYGIRVNDLNFWEEMPGGGVQKVIQTAKPETGVTSQGWPRVTLKQVLHWVAPQDAFLPDTTRVALLIEQRTLMLTVDEAHQEVALVWASEFEVGTKTNQVTLTGANYHGLGLRFMKDLDPLAVHLNSSNKPDLSGNQQDVAQGKWGSVSFNVPGHPATVVVYGHPANERGDAWFFTMKTPFAYLSATQGLEKKALVYRSGDRFQLRYLITVHTGILSPESIAKRGHEWESAGRGP